MLPSLIVCLFLICGDRTTLTPEPELGRKKLDLLKLYKKVTEAGGYDFCTTEKGQSSSYQTPSISKCCLSLTFPPSSTLGVWRDLAQSYKLAANNTNAGYLLKTIYYKNLAYAPEGNEMMGIQ